MAAANTAKSRPAHAKGSLKELDCSATGNDDLRDEGKDDQSLANFKQAGEKLKDAFSK